MRAVLGSASIPVDAFWRSFMPRNSCMPRKLQRSLLWILGVAFLAALVAWQQFGVGSGEESWDYGELAPAVGEDGSLQSERGDRKAHEDVANVALDEAEPLDCELRLTAVSALGVADRRYGKERLRIESFTTMPSANPAVPDRRDVPCTLEFLAGLPASNKRRLASSAEIGGLPRGRFVLRFRRVLTEGRDVEAAAIFETIVRLPSAQPVRIDWSARGGLRGRVEDERGKPVRDAEVEVQGRRAKVDREGRFVIDGLVAGSSVPVIVRASRRLLYCEMVEVAAANRAAELRFSLPRAWALRVTAPIRDAERITLVPASGGARFFPYFALRPRALGRGRFEIDGLPLGQDFGVAVLDDQRACHAPTIVKAPLTSRVLDAVVRSEIVDVLSGKVRLGGEAPGERAGALRVLAFDDKKRPWGETLFVRDALIAPAWSALGACEARVGPEGSYRVGMPAKRTRVRAGVVSGDVRSLSSVAESKVLYRARRLRADFDLARSPKASLPAGGDSARGASLHIRFTGLPSRVRRLRVQVYWSGQLHGKPILHDPRKALEIALGGPALLDLQMRRRAGGEGLQARLRAVGAVTGCKIAYSELSK